MASTDTGRERLRRARANLEGWTFEARDQAYAEFFEGSDAVLTDEELRLLDRIDSALARRGDAGVWGADAYGIVDRGQRGDGPQVVCVYHPEIPDEGFPGIGRLDEATRAELNDVLWEYAERVASLVQLELDAFLQEVPGE